MITIDKAYLQPSGEPDAALLDKLMAEHKEVRARLESLREMYERNHAITSRTRLKGLPNNKLVHDLPGYIATMAAGYLVGNPITYTPPEGQEAAMEALNDALLAACSDSVDAELAVDASVYGKGIEICYADEQANPCVAQLDALSAFVVYDDTVEHAPLFGVTIHPMTDAQRKKAGERVIAYTKAECIRYESKEGGKLREVGREPHYFGGVPVVEYWNNAREQGDFEPVMGLIDAYDVLQSDRVNDKQQFTDSILALYGIGALGADDTEEVSGGEVVGEGQKDTMTPSQRLRQTRTLFMPGEGARAEWLVKPLNEGDTEILRMSLRNDIHKFCFVPDLTDENFAGNASGVAMKYKLLGLEQLTKIKERWFREGLRQRLRLFAAFLSMRGAAALNADAVQIGFHRALPINDLEIAQTVSTYEGLVPKGLLLGQVPFVEDASAAMDMLKAEQDEAVKRQQDAFGPQKYGTSGAEKEPPEEDGE